MTHNVKKGLRTALPEVNPSARGKESLISLQIFSKPRFLRGEILGRLENQFETLSAPALWLRYDRQLSRKSERKNRHRYKYITSPAERLKLILWKIQVFPELVLHLSPSRQKTRHLKGCKIWSVTKKRKFPKNRFIGFSVFIDFLWIFTTSPKHLYEASWSKFKTYCGLGWKKQITMEILKLTNNIGSERKSAY